ncbi:dehydrogenase E1 and transketolase domain-containing protein 1 [Gautieria morchelliformis]|nr:dehydrogenase E1 and transketolase domain-containing protein 1 [Gautieria morchelliformis]
MRGIGSQLVQVRAIAVRATGVRKYHDESFGYRQARPFELPDYTPSQLSNRTANAPLLRYVDSLRMHGHRAAKIDPLDLLQREEVAALNPSRYGLDDPERRFPIDGIIWNKPAEDSRTDSGSEEWSMRQITHHLRAVYVGRIAYEYMHGTSKTERLWFSHLLESTSEDPGAVMTAGKRKRIWELLVRSEVFDQFLQTKFPNLKRYGLEGGESMLPALDSLFRVASIAGIEHIILAMPHRGRLNLLTEPTLLKYPHAALFHKIKGKSEIPEEFDADGDVISHLFASPSLSFEGASAPMKVNLLPNPSHLEAVNPVALGLARAKQYTLLKSPDYASDPECTLGDKVMCVQLHGDASFTGQGIVMEAFGLSNLPHFTSGGSVHLVVNNNIGYTTPASSARSSLYCSDVAKMINAPVLHVNGDYPEDVARAMEVAFKYRNHFRKDIVVDLMVYRRWGHNELDEPAFTQPLMYQTIRTRKSVPTLYEERLVESEILPACDTQNIRDAYRTHLDTQLAAVQSHQPTADMLGGKWSGLVWPGPPTSPSVIVHNPATGLDLDTLRRIGHHSVEVPEGFEIHSRLRRHVKHRLESLERGAGIDWATAEALAWGSLMREGHDIRISGQDVGRGTFSHRHAMLVDQNTESVVVPLNAAISPDQGRLELANSSLSELAVLGFEFGMSWERPNILPIWEAQFGDFFNGAQVMIDTFVSSAEAKWLKQSGIVILLPHGLDGAGPEHSSMRLERFLQLTNDSYEFDATLNINMQIANLTTPAQYFHILRRQQLRNFRKPLVIATPKGLLRAPAAASNLADFAPGSMFQPVLLDPLFVSSSTRTNLKRIILCSGKIYYDLAAKREEKNVQTNVALVRLEELAPFPWNAVSEALDTYLSSDGQADIVWVQEEAKNQGPWTHISARVDNLLARRGAKLKFIGRRESAVPAVGVGELFQKQKAEVLEQALTLME